MFDFSKEEVNGIKDLGWDIGGFESNKDKEGYDYISLKGGWLVSYSDVKDIRGKMFEDNDECLEDKDIKDIIELNFSGVLCMLGLIEEVGYYNGRSGIDYMLDESGVYLEGSVVSEDGNIYKFDFREEGDK